ncbi:hypothetical protein LBMAG21_07940 [Armatimonadota bacterium]|nr:hypothetical protein LBMAG21_07940 [Armatimonadota bacterium]
MSEQDIPTVRDYKEGIYLMLETGSPVRVLDGEKVTILFPPHPSMEPTEDEGEENTDDEEEEEETDDEEEEEEEEQSEGLKRFKVNVSRDVTYKGWVSVYATDKDAAIVEAQSKSSSEINWRWDWMGGTIGEVDDEFEIGSYEEE